MNKEHFIKEYFMMKKSAVMRKSAVMVLSFLMILSLAACGSRQEGGQDDSSSSGSSSLPEASSAAAAEESGADSGTGGAQAGSQTDSQAGSAASGGNILIAYFSVPETDGADTVSGASRVVTEGEVLGNNQYVAQLIQQETGGDLFRIETVQEYPGSHDALLEFAYEERAEDARPELSSHIENPDDYDVIFLGYPNWNSDLPMPLYTFLEEYDFSGKTIIPFTVHGGSGLSRTVRTIAELQPDATVVEDGLAISRNSVTEAQSDVEDWVAGLDVLA